MRPVYRSLSLALMGMSVVACSGDANPVELTRDDQALWHDEPTPTVPAPAQPFTNFETLQVRPLALSPNGRVLFAANTPDNRLEIFRIKPGNWWKSPDLVPIASVSVGLEPISVAARSDSEVWVANHLSDSISVVKLDGNTAKVVRTLHVGDEPRDIVFAGPDKSRAFITTAHRGQNSPDSPDLFIGPPELSKPNFAVPGRADVWVFDANNLGSAAGGTRLTKLTMFADTPRALATTADGSKVYAAPFFSGNQTTVASADAVRQLYAASIHPDNPNIFCVAPDDCHRLTSRVVKWKAGSDGVFHWFDDLGTVFDRFIRVSLPDHDVFTIDATANPPAVVASKTFDHAGTSLFNMAVNPVNGKVYVANTEAHNDVRFEGHNGDAVSSVRGEAVDSRISVLDPSRDPATDPFVHNDLNSHVVDGVGDAALSRTFPQDLTVSSDGRKLYVVLQGSQKLGIYETADLEAGIAAPTAQNQVLLSAGGPAGVVLDECNDLAFVLTRFDNGISIVDLGKRREIGHRKMFNPEPASITEGRRFLYDATFTSANGTQACASCHIGGDLDALSWDLGNPGGLRLPITTVAASEETLWTFSPTFIQSRVSTTVGLFDDMDNLKGPMGTQSLRGLANHGSMHWRGDRNGAVQQDGTPFLDSVTGLPVESAQPDRGMFDEFLAFTSFNVAFPGLLGRAEELAESEMAAFATFALELVYPPNPIRNLDDSLTPTQAAGRAFYFNVDANGNELPVDRLHNCNGCHTLDPSGNAGQSDHPGFFGSDGRLSFENLPQTFKVAHLRNAYQKVGMFASSIEENRALTLIPTINPPLPAVRGFGYQPDGAVGSVEHHLSGRGFIKTTFPDPNIGPNPGGIPTFTFDDAGHPTGFDPSGIPVRRAIAEFVMAYDSNLRPIVGQQITLTPGAGNDILARIDLLEARAAAGDCDVVASGRVRNKDRSYVLVNGSYLADRDGVSLSSSELRARLRNHDALTFTCMPPGYSYRGIDRDMDGYADGDELDAHSDPADSSDTPDC